MSRALFPTITPDVARRYIGQGRAEINAVALRIHYLMHAQRARDAGNYTFAAAMLRLAERATNTTPAVPGVTCSNPSDARGAGMAGDGQV